MSVRLSHLSATATYTTNRYSERSQHHLQAISVKLAPKTAFSEELGSSPEQRELFRGQRSKPFNSIRQSSPMRSWRAGMRLRRLLVFLGGEWQIDFCSDLDNCFDRRFSVLAVDSFQLGSQRCRFLHLFEERLYVSYGHIAYQSPELLISCPIS